MPVEQLDIQKLDEHEFIPQAILNLPPSYFTERFGITFIDQNDFYLGAGKAAVLCLNGELTFALMHYPGTPENPGYPEGTTAVYLPQDITDVSRITVLISRINQEMGIHRRFISWQRRDNPES